MNDISTKEKILKESHKLFADKGFNGVSVREIAKICDVNIAAINYHFKNKENLYIEVFKQSILSTQTDIQNIYENSESKDLEEMSIKIFKHFIEHSEDLRMSFKLILSQTQFDSSFAGMVEKYPGPPGGEYLHECIVQAKPNAKKEDVEWAVRTIFGQIIHKAIVVCNSSICKQIVKHHDYEDEVFENDLRRLVRIIKNDL